MTDTHCHIHSADYPLDADVVLKRARDQGVDRFACIGTSLADSREAVAFAAERDDCWAAVAVHPHEAEGFGDEDKAGLLELLNSGNVNAIGECGLDYYYEHSPRSDQKAMLHWHLQQAVAYNLPLSFHIREAFDDFWQIYDQYDLPKPGVVHSFSAGRDELSQALERGLLIAINGIMTFSKDPEQLAALDALPLKSLVLETDAPFLTPAPKRGTINEPRYVNEVATFIAQRRDVSLAELEQITDANAQTLFGS